MPARNLRAVSLALLLGATAATTAQESGAYLTDLQESLAAYAADDFAGGNTRPTGFRKVDLRYRENDHGARAYMLCGQVQFGAGTKPGWVDFATVRTKPFEQWIGGTAAEICALATPVSPGGHDLSALIETKRRPP